MISEGCIIAVRGYDEIPFSVDCTGPHSTGEIVPLSCRDLTERPRREPCLADKWVLWCVEKTEEDFQGMRGAIRPMWGEL